MIPPKKTPSFENTEIAFQSKRDDELKKAGYLFKMISSTALVKLGGILINTALRLRIPIGWAIKNNVFHHFCGGQTISECQRVIQLLGKYHVGTILDYSVEGKTQEVDLNKNKDEILKTIQAAKGNPLIPFCVFKMTGLARFNILEKVHAHVPLTEAESAEWQRVRHRVDEICCQAASTGTPLFIDAEDSWIQDAIDALVVEMMEKYNGEKAIVYTTLQLYRHDRLDYLKKLHREAVEKNYFIGVKLVRGAYMEKERARAKEKGYTDPIYPDKVSCDRAFNAASRYCLDHVDRIAQCCGSHNEESNRLLAQWMDEKGIERNDLRVCFAQLYGMSDHISFNLADAGYNVTKYVPYGPIREVTPYLIRRAQENTSVKGQSGRELPLIEKELQRRKLLLSKKQ